MTKSKQEMREEFVGWYRSEIELRGGDQLSDTPSPDEVADYWLNIIDQQQNSLREKIEKMRKKETMDSVVPNSRGLIIETLNEKITYNRALSDVLTLLNKEI